MTCDHRDPLGATYKRYICPVCSEQLQEAPGPLRASAYLGQAVNYGGESVSRGELYQRLGDAQAGAWLAGYDRANQ
jgi:hypothetical protein